MSVQSQLTFVEAKNFCLHRLSYIVAFAESMFNISPNPWLMQYIIQLETLHERIIQATKPKLHENEINQLRKQNNTIDGLLESERLTSEKGCSDVVQEKLKTINVTRAYKNQVEDSIFTGQLAKYLNRSK